MGVYDHMARPSMGHKLQVDLRHSMERYHDDKHHLQKHLGQLRLRSRDLHTTPLTPSPDPPVNRWGEAGSKFSQAPEVAARKARQAQLEQENARRTNHDSQPDIKANKPPLPPIPDNTTTTTPTTSTNNNTTDKARTAPAEKDQPCPKADTQQTEVTTTKPAATKPSPRAVQNKKGTMMKGGRFQRKPVVVKKGGPVKDRLLPVIQLPTIYSASERRSVWDSGRHHLRLQGPSTHLEKNQVDEDCRTFSHRSKPIPPIMDNKRAEIHRPLRAPGGQAAQLPFRGQPLPAPVPHTEEAVHSIPADPNQEQPTVDHFPKNTPRLPELDDGSSEEEDTEDGTVDPRDRSLIQPHLQPLRRSSTMYQSAPQPVPLLRLRRGMTPSAVSTATARSGATYMSMVSQETQEWKGAYMSTDDPYFKSRMLMDILHATRQRMYDNEEDLRQYAERQEEEGRSDVMLVHRDSVAESGANTNRSSVPQQQKPLKLPHHHHHHHHKKQAVGGREGHRAKLHRYLNRLSNQRKGGDPPSAPHPFHLATMPIREITQSSLEHQSAVQTTS